MTYLNTIQNMDCLDFLPKLEPETIDCGIYDIPYYTSKKRKFTFTKNGKATRKPYSTDMGSWDWFDSETAYFEWVRQVLQATIHILKPNASLYLFCKDGYISKFKRILQEEGYLFKSIIIWAKTNPLQNIMHLNYNMACEWQLFAIRNDKNARSTPYIFNWLDQTQIRFPPEYKSPPFPITMHNVIESAICMKPERITDKGKVVHPSQKPIEVLLRPIVISSHPKSTVLDATCGVGSTCETARLLKRNWIGCEISPYYCKFAQQRMQGKLEGYDLAKRVKYIIKVLNAQKYKGLLRWVNKKSEVIENEV